MRESRSLVGVEAEGAHEGPVVVIQGAQVAGLVDLVGLCAPNLALAGGDALQLGGGGVRRPLQKLGFGGGRGHPGDGPHL